MCKLSKRFLVSFEPEQQLFMKFQSAYFDFLANYRLGFSPTGWTNTEIFVNFIEHHFYPHLVSQKILFPVYLFVDNHASHIALESAEICNKYNIILTTLYPNATRIIQPLDRVIFGPFKNEWRKEMEVWRAENKDQDLPLEDFAPLLYKVNQSVVNTSLISKAFEATGLHPLNPEAVNYDLCIGQEHSRSIEDPLMCCDDIQFEVEVTLNRLKQINESLGDNKKNMSTERVLKEIEFLEKKLDNLWQSSVKIINESISGNQGKVTVLRNVTMRPSFQNQNVASELYSKFIYNPPLATILKPHDKAKRVGQRSYKTKLPIIISHGVGLEMLQSIRNEKERATFEKENRKIQRQIKKN